MGSFLHIHTYTDILLQLEEEITEDITEIKSMIMMIVIVVLNKSKEIFVQCSDV